MKKAKIMLMVITVLGIAGGALAFKAKKFGTNVVVFSKCDTHPAILECELGTVTYVSYTTGSGVNSITVAGTTNPELACTTDTDCQGLITIHPNQ